MSRTTPGMVTMVGRLRILNGDVESLRRMRKPGRPKLTKNIVSHSPAQPFPGEEELRELGIRNGFQLIRSKKYKDQITLENKILQGRFDLLCSEVREGQGFNLDGVSRIERSVPSSFCSCKDNRKNEYISCLVHGLKQEDCACAGIDGITGTRLCYGHRQTDQMTAVKPFPETDRMKKAREAADRVAQEIGWI